MFVIRGSLFKVSKLQIFGNRVVRIWAQESRVVSVSPNQELRDFYRPPDCVRIVNSRGIKWMSCSRTRR